MRKGVIFGGGVLMAIAMLMYFSYAPGRYHILKPIDLKETPTFITDLKLRFSGREACYQALQDSAISFTPLPDEVKGRGCEYYEVAKLDYSLLEWGEGVTLRCPALAGLTMWERHNVIPVAEKILGSKVTRVDHFGTYACRNINNTKRGRRSQHASANAIDIAGFRLEDGRTVSVKHDWGKDSDEGRFLKAIHKSACKRFNTVLGPEYNALHHDHFHFDNGPSVTCN